MAKLMQRPTVQVEAIFTVNEAELRTLDALAGYGDDAFIRAFYERLAEAYTRDHEKGLRESLENVRSLASSVLNRADAARVALKRGGA